MAVKLEGWERSAPTTIMADVTATSGVRAEGESPPRILFVSTYPPTRCGIASFTCSLAEALSHLRASGEDLAVARLVTPDDVLVPDPNVEVFASPECPSWPAAVARASQRFDVVWIQHEFGIFGPHGASAIEDLLRLVNKPVVTSLHTVLRRPDPEQRSVVDSLLARSDAVVVMSNAARNRLIEVHGADPSGVCVVPHGVSPRLRREAQPGEHPTILTWGLLGPGKGIEWGIRALAQLSHLHPRPKYVVAGATHPNVLRAQGQSYRRRLERLATDLGVADMVTLEEVYVSPERLAELLASAKVILLPYDSSEQVTSGVLVEAIGAGRAVVATDFPHSVELLGGGAGTLVPHQDPEAIAAALERYLTDADARCGAEEAAIQLRSQLLWSSIAQQSESVAREAVSRRFSWKEPALSTPTASLGRLVQSAARNRDSSGAESA